MKKAILLITIITALSSVLFYSCKEEDFESSKPTSSIKTSSTATKGGSANSTQSLYEGQTIGVEKGQRKNCPPGTTKLCCDRKFCVVTPTSGMDNSPVLALNYFEGTISQHNDYQLKIAIPENKILSESYAVWFIDDVFEAEYFPLMETVTNPIGLSNIAIVAGNYNVTHTEGVGYEIIVDFVTQTGE